MLQSFLRPLTGSFLSGVQTAFRFMGEHRAGSVAEEKFIVQRVLAPGGEIDLSYLRTGNYVETLDLSGPRLMLELNDVNGVLRMDYGLQEGDDLMAAIADPHQRDGMSADAVFVVKKVVHNGPVLHVMCLQKEIDELKKPSPIPVFFVQKPVTEIISRFISMPARVTDAPVVEDYHLLPGERPSRLLRQVAYEQGAVVYARRGELHFDRLRNLFSRAAGVTYHYEDRGQENQVISYVNPNVDAIVRDKAVRKYAGWSPTEGYVEGGAAGDSAPVEWRSSSHVATLSNLGSAGIPAIDFVCLGNGEITSGMVMDFVWNLDRTDAPMDESLPQKVVVSSVAHYYSRWQKYLCRVKGVVPLEVDSHGR